MAPTRLSRFGFILTSRDGGQVEEIAQGYRNTWHRKSLPDGHFESLTPTQALEAIKMHLDFGYTIAVQER